MKVREPLRRHEFDKHKVTCVRSNYIHIALGEITHTGHMKKIMPLNKTSKDPDPITTSTIQLKKIV